MHIEWILSPEKDDTRMSIVHDLHVKPRWKGWWLERLIAKPTIEQTARNVLAAIKFAAEKGAAA